MAKDNDDNKKISKPPGEVTGLIDSRYLRATVNFDGTGSQLFSPIKFSEALEKSFDEQWSSTGGYTSREAHKKTELSTSLGYEFRGYNIGGTSTSTEAHRQSYTQDTSETSIDGDEGHTTGKSELRAVKEKRIAVYGQPGVTYQATASKNPQVHAASGDLSYDTTDNMYISVEKDSVRVTSENDIATVQNGDYARHIQSGNWDTHIAQQARMYADNDILIESKTKITIKVGASYIEILPDKITIQSALVDINP